MVGRAKLIFGTIVVRRRWRVWDLQALGNCVLFESVSWSADSRNKNSLRSPGKSAVQDWITQKVEES